MDLYETAYLEGAELPPDSGTVNFRSNDWCKTQQDAHGP